MPGPSPPPLRAQVRPGPRGACSPSHNPEETLRSRAAGLLPHAARAALAPCSFPAPGGLGAPVPSPVRGACVPCSSGPRPCSPQRETAPRARVPRRGPRVPSLSSLTLGSTLSGGRPCGLRAVGRTSACGAGARAAAGLGSRPSAPLGLDFGLGLACGQQLGHEERALWAQAVPTPHLKRFPFASPARVCVGGRVDPEPQALGGKHPGVGEGVEEPGGKGLLLSGPPMVSWPHPHNPRDPPTLEFVPSIPPLPCLVT